EILKDALRIELARTPIDWNVAEPLLRKVIEKNDKDARAHYYLARFEYEQPIEDHRTAAQLGVRSPERIDKARDHLGLARQNGSPYWRTVGLEAEILDWPLRTAQARKLKPDAVAAAERVLDQLLFDPQNGAIAVAGRGEKLTGLGVADSVGISSVLITGMER